MQATTLIGAARLTHWGLIRASGTDAATFLHGQLSQDVQSLDSGHARLAAYCTAKGRMLASMLLLRPAEDEIWLLCSADVLPATLKRLSMFVLRAKAKLTDASAEMALLGYVGTPPAAEAGESPVWSVCAVADGRVLRLPDAPAAAGQPVLPRWIWLGSEEAAAARLQSAPALPLAAWQWLEVQSGIPTITQAVVEQFVPQMVNFELIGGVNFKKGCYPGQEIVARSQYLGKLKRRMVLVNSNAPLQAGQEVYANTDPAQPAGMVVNAAQAPSGGYGALVEIKVASLDGGTLHAGGIDGPVLSPAALPYALPGEGEPAA